MYTSKTKSIRTDWCTPKDLIDRIVFKFGNIGLDPCSNEDSIVPAKTRWTIDDDGLKKDWSGYGLVYVNPPCGRGISVWVEKMISEHKKGVDIVALLPSSTDTIWFHRLLRYFDHQFIKGRIKFLGGKHPAPFPSVLFYNYYINKRTA